MSVERHMIGRGRAASPAGPHPVAGAWPGLAAWRFCLAAWVFWPDQLLRSPTWSAYVFWVGIALGCMGLTMLHHLVGGSWGLVVRRPMEAGGMTLLPLAVLFLPLALGLSRLYPWARPEEVALDRSSSTRASI